MGDLYDIEIVEENGLLQQRKNYIKEWLICCGIWLSLKPFEKVLCRAHLDHNPKFLRCGSLSQNRVRRAFRFEVIHITNDVYQKVF